MWVCFQLLFLVLYLLSFMDQGLYLFRVLDTTNQSSILFLLNSPVLQVTDIKDALATWLQLTFPHCAYKIVSEAAGKPFLSS